MIISATVNILLNILIYKHFGFESESQKSSPFKIEDKYFAARLSDFLKILVLCQFQTDQNFFEIKYPFTALFLRSKKEDLYNVK